MKKKEVWMLPHHTRGPRFDVTFYDENWEPIPECSVKNVTKAEVVVHLQTWMKVKAGDIDLSVFANAALFNAYLVDVGVMNGQA